jgi:hypothetical protein
MLGLPYSALLYLSTEGCMENIASHVSVLRGDSEILLSPIEGAYYVSNCFHRTCRTR